MMLYMRDISTLIMDQQPILYRYARWCADILRYAIGEQIGWT